MSGPFGPASPNVAVPSRIVAELTPPIGVVQCRPGRLLGIGRAPPSGGLPCRLDIGLYPVAKRGKPGVLTYRANVRGRGPPDAVSTTHRRSPALPALEQPGLWMCSGAVTSEHVMGSGQLLRMTLGAERVDLGAVQDPELRRRRHAGCSFPTLVPQLHRIARISCSSGTSVGKRHTGGGRALRGSSHLPSCRGRRRGADPDNPAFAWLAGLPARRRRAGAHPTERRPAPRGGHRPGTPTGRVTWAASCGGPTQSVRGRGRRAPTHTRPALR